MVKPGTRGAIVTLVFLAGLVLPVDESAMAQGESYFPLAAGNRWELRAPRTNDAMVLEVTNRDGDDYVVRWTNPWVPGLHFRFAPRDGQIFLTGLDMGQGLNSLPEGAYFDFTKRQGSQWQNALGRFRVTRSGERITTPSGTYDQTIEIETIDNEGKSMFWTFARGVGPVRFGRGGGAHLLTLADSDASVAERRPPARRPAPRAPRTQRRDSRLLISMDSNPPESEGSSTAAARRAYERAANAGIGFVHAVLTWGELEPSAGRYTWSPLDFRVEMAERHNLGMNLNFRIVDTNNRSGPYSRLKFSDPNFADAVVKALRAMGPRTKGRVRWIAIGNEIDSYFGSHSGEIDDYARLLEQVLPVVREQFPGALFTVNFGFGAVDRLQMYRPITDLVDAYSFTYYPLNGDFTMRSPDVVFSDVDKMVRAAGDRPLIMQEIGYASASRLKSSEDQQARFVSNAFAALKRHQGQILGASFLFMSDLPEKVVEDLGKYYKLPNSDNFKAYLATLGFFDRQGRAKPAWNVFERETKALPR